MGELERVPIESNTLSSVMAGLVPAIHVFAGGTKDVDARAKRGHDEWLAQGEPEPNAPTPKQPQTLTFSSSTTRLTAGRASMRSLNAV